MKRRVLLFVLVAISLILAVVILRSRRSVDMRWEQSLARLENLPKAERDRFHSNAMDFYQYNSRAARDERKRLRTLYHQIQNSPESDRLTATMKQYVDWVSRSGDPATMRELQSKSMIARVEDIHKIVQDERQSGSEMPDSLERLKESLRENLVPELQSVALQPLADAFDAWLTQKYAEAKAGLTEEQQKHLPKFEKFYRDLFRQAGMETASANSLAIPEKLVMLQLIQNLSLRSGGNGGFPPRMGGGMRPGGGGFPRFGGGPPFGGGGFRNDFLEKINDALTQQEPNPLDSLDESARQTLTRMDRLPRLEAMQRLLTLAVLERSPAIDTGLFFQAVSRMDQQKWSEILGVYLSMMDAAKREDYLKQDSRFTLNRLQDELRFNALAWFSLFRTRPPENRPPENRLPGMGPPPPPPRDVLPNSN